MVLFTWRYLEKIRIFHSLFSVWEQIIICMVLLAAILHLSSIITSSLFLLIFDDEPLCLYVAGTSMGVAGMFCTAL